MSGDSSVLYNMNLYGASCLNNLWLIPIVEIRSFVQSSVSVIRAVIIALFGKKLYTKKGAKRLFIIRRFHVAEDFEIHALLLSLPCPSDPLCGLPYMPYAADTDREQQPGQ